MDVFRGNNAAENFKIPRRFCKLADNPHQFVGEFGGDILRYLEVIGQKRRRIARGPLRDRDLLEDGTIEQGKKLRRLLANLFDAMAETALDEANLTLLEFFGSHASVRAEDRYT
jgi:hypothetical protein